MKTRLPSERKAAEAKKLLVHYFTLLGEKSGIELNSESVSEIEYAVDMIIESAFSLVMEEIDNG